MRNPYWQGPVSSNFDGVRFFNPGEPDTDRSLRQLLRWQFGRRKVEWPGEVPVTPAVPEPEVDALRVTVVGHATALIQAPGLNILTDPVWSERASPVRFAGPKRATAPGIRFDDLPRIDAVLLSHNHYDHLDIDTLRRLHERDAPLVVTPLGNDAILRKHMPGMRTAAGDWWSRFELAAGTEVHIVPANHWSSRTVRDRRMALWGGFFLRMPAGTLYFAGDTGYGTGAAFKAIHRRLGGCDLALIPIGAYEPRWFMSAQHCDPEEAVRIMLDVGARKAVGIHWGTFALTDEAREEPPERLRATLAAHGIDSGRFEAAFPGMVVSA
ncbi:MBL fold metallo-hydrolase [Azospirillum lipoferum]|uniref:Metallo-hydrolase/oxidoreductase n=1 Tax=Azospirillum lipoferum (strain 4B) TaxID=862719 RepID=G7ZCY7_AZOL4|nr:MBL fold metallo-hydrolase [Azospirillum lipoferum]CBS89744.1 putative metallo-hydrolase/oxidoreductase [Azospirillum lipoferum 4B]